MECIAPTSPHATLVSPASVAAAFVHVPDPRRQASVHYPLPAILSLAVVAVLCAHTSVLAVPNKILFFSDFRAYVQLDRVLLHIRFRVPRAAHVPGHLSDEVGALLRRPVPDRGRGCREYCGMPNSEPVFPTDEPPAPDE